MMFLKKKYYYYFPLIFICGYYLFQSYFFEIHDFANYYFGGKFLNEGVFNSTIYFPYHFNKTIADLDYQNIFVSYAPNTPFISIIFWVFSFLEIGISKLLFNSISLTLLIISIFRLFNYHTINKKYILLLPIVFFIPIKNNLLFGQVYFLLFFLLSEGYLAYQKKNYKALAIYWSLAIFLKVFPILLVLFLIFKKKYKATIFLITSSVLILVFSVLITGIDIWIFYFTSVLNRASNGEIAGAYVDNYQSIYMFLKRLIVYNETYNRNVIFNSLGVFTTIILIVKLFLIGAGIYITKKESNSIITFSFWILLSIIISPYGSTYGFVLLLFLFVAFSQSSTGFNYKLIGFVLLFGISNNNLIPKYYFPLNYMRLFFICTLIAIILWNYKKQIQFKNIIIPVIALSTITTLFKGKKNSLNTLIKTPILTYDYKIENAEITYLYWNENGENIKKEKFKYQSLDSSNIKIIKNQIYYKEKQITFDNSNKKKAIVLDNKKVIFLSDSDIGIGFYGIRELDL